jgi:hypothetical protein
MLGRSGKATSENVSLSIVVTCALPRSWRQRCEHIAAGRGQVNGTARIGTPKIKAGV